MEIMNETNNLKKNNINYEIAERLWKLWESKWKSVIRDESSPNYFEYMGRKMWVWLEVVWAEVWDIPDESDYIYTVKLWDIALCEDFRTVLENMQKEKWINIKVYKHISISDCVKLLWLDNNVPTADKMIADSDTKFKNWAYYFIEREAKEFSKTWLAFYSIDVIDWEFYLKASNRFLMDMIINKDEKFYYEIIRVITRLTEKLPIKFQEYVEKRRERENNEKNETEKNISNLKNNI